MNSLCIADREECCSWCRQPVALCRDPACDDTRTYFGVLRRGEWVDEAGDAREFGMLQALR